MTAKDEIPLKELLRLNLPDTYDAEVVIAAGGAWKDRKRIHDPNFLIGRGITIKVNVSEFQGKAYSLDREQVIFENDDLLVVYKPCNLNVHGVPASMHYNLAHGVNGYLRGRGINFEATPITRLDRPVEGLVLFGKHKFSEKKLFSLVKNRRIRKWYMAGLERHDGPKYRRIRDRLANDGAKTLLDDNGKDADSLFVKTASTEWADIYSVYIFTGRRHQIRFHASHYIEPVIGDNYYGSSVALPPDEIALLCRGYNIPYGRTTLRVRLPQFYLDRFYKRLKGNRLLTDLVNI